MPRSYTGLVPLISIPLLIVGCASNPGSSGGRGAYFESSYGNHDRAPASMTPPTPSSDAATTIDPTYMRTQADFHFATGEAYALEGHHQKAIDSYKMTLIYDPESAAVRLRLAAEYLKIGLLSEALEQTQDAVKKDPKNVDGFLLLGGLYSTMKTYEKAVDAYHEVLKLNPAHTEAPLFLGAVWSEQKQYDKAVKAFEKLATSAEYSSPYLAWYYVGRVRAEQHEAKYFKTAEKAFRKALELKPDHVDSVLALSTLYSEHKDEQKGLDLLIHFEKEQGSHARVAELLAQYFIEKNRYDEAYVQLEVLEASGDDPLSAKLRMSLILIEKKMYDQATGKLEDILKEAPDSDKVRFYLGAVYEETHRDEKAVFHFHKIGAESAYFDEAMIHSAYLLKGLGRLDEAVSLMETTLTKKKDVPQMYAMYASLLDEKTEFKKADAVLADAIRRFPENAQLHFYNGTVQDHLGNKTKVVEEMQKVIELDPNHIQGLNYLAFTWAEDGARLQDAEKMARRATELDPKDGYVLDTLGWVLYKKGDYAESIRLLEAAMRYQPTVSVIAEHLGDAYTKKSMGSKATEMYSKALKFETDQKRINSLKSKISSVNGGSGIEARIPAGESGR